MKSKEVRGNVFVQKIWIRAKRGSISGRQHEDVGYIDIYFEPDGGNTRISLRNESFTSKGEMDQRYLLLCGNLNLDSQ